MRKYFALASESPFAASMIVCLLFGLLSLLLGQDSNWDLLNYHLYNPFAWINHKIGLDIAAAGFQGYFNPLLDLPYYWMTLHWPAPVAGFVLGVWHGLVFGFLYIVVAGTLDRTALPQPRRVAMALAGAGTLATNVVFGVGNSMGDTSVTVLILASLALVIRNWPRFERGQGNWALLCAGLIAGAGGGLKLTNAPYALALCLGFAFSPLPLKQRARLMVVFGLGAGMGVAATTGWWWLRMWHTFGNPLFPQFSHWFPNPWASPIDVADTRWLPKSLREALLWPFIYTLNGARVGETRMHQMLWPLTYVLFVAWAIAVGVQRKSASAGTDNQRRLSPAAVYLLAVLALGYGLWMKMFSIYRYTGPIEVLLPLAVWLLWHRLLRKPAAHRAAGWSIAICIPVALLVGAKTWGHEDWARQAFRVQTPAIAQPRTATVLVISQPLAWLVTGFSPDLAVAGIGSSFPADVGYWKAVENLTAARKGDVYAIVGTVTDWRAASLRQTDDTLDSLGLTSHSSFCAGLASVLKHTKLRVALVGRRPEQAATIQCALTSRPQDRVNVEAEDQRLLAEADNVLSPVAMKLDRGSCQLYPAYIGKGFYPYQWCKVLPR